MLELPFQPLLQEAFEKAPWKSAKLLYRIYHFIFVKLLKFQETFHEKFLVSGIGADAPTLNARKKRGIAVFFSIDKF